MPGQNGQNNGVGWSCWSFCQALRSRGSSAGLRPPLTFLSTVAREGTGQSSQTNAPARRLRKSTDSSPKPDQIGMLRTDPYLRKGLPSSLTFPAAVGRPGPLAVIYAVNERGLRRQWGRGLRRQRGGSTPSMGRVYAVNGAGSAATARARAASGGRGLPGQAAEVYGVSRRGSRSASDRRTNRRAPAGRAAGSGPLGIATDPPVSEGTAPGHSGPIPTRCGARHETGPPRRRCGAGDRSRRSVELQGQDARVRALPSKLRPCGLAPSTVAGLGLSGNDPDASFPSSQCPT